MVRMWNQIPRALHVLEGRNPVQYRYPFPVSAVEIWNQIPLHVLKGGTHFITACIRYLFSVNVVGIDMEPDPTTCAEGWNPVHHNMIVLSTSFL